jgi:hypothetical protein
MNAAYFHAKFSAIPDEKWLVGNYLDNPPQA